jgi:hypothetical protein
MPHALRRISSAAVIATVAVLGTSLGTSPASAEPEPEPAPAPAPASALAVGGLTLDNSGSDEEVDEVVAAALCVFTTNGDHVHVSSSAFEASGHGWWVNGNCRARTAVVTVQLQQFYSDGKWRNVGSAGKKTVRSGGGSGNRATGRAACNNRSVTGWRSVIDVDLVGQADDPRKLTTPARNIACRR